MKIKLFTILIILAMTSCSGSIQISDNSNSVNVSVENRSANKDLTKPVNLNNPRERKNADKLIEELNKNREFWKSQNISDYDYICEALPVGMTGYTSASIKVRDGETNSLEEIGMAEGIFHYNYEKMDSINKIFDFIEGQIQQGSSADVKYNRKFGFPENWAIGFSIQTHGSQVFRLTSFKIIKKMG